MSAGWCQELWVSRHRSDRQESAAAGYLSTAVVIAGPGRVLVAPLNANQGPEMTDAMMSLRTPLELLKVQLRQLPNVAA